MELLPSLDLFVHIPQATYAKISAQFGSWTRKIPVRRSLKQVNRLNRLLRQISISHQISLRTRHSHNAWMVSSTSSPQFSHTSLRVTFRLHKFFFVGSALQQARHRKCLILLRTFRLHFFFQIPLFAAGFDWPDLDKASISGSIRYALLVV